VTDRDLETAQARREKREHVLDRVTAFTDGTVAIAITLLVLPLVDIAREGGNSSVLDELQTYRGEILAFAVSFLVIAQFWAGHRRLFAHLVGVDDKLLFVNIVWLMLVVFLPYPTARLFVQSDVHTDAAVFYLGSMLAISLTQLGLSAYVLTHRALWREGESMSWRHLLVPSIAVSAVFAVAVGVSFVNPSAGLWTLLLLGVVQRVAARYVSAL
jgi:uncharacterized membrane protein